MTTPSPRGALPQLRFDQASLDFGVVDTDSSGALLTATLYNDSDSAAATLLHFDSDPTFPLMYQFGSCEGFDLPPGASCTVRIKFAPTEAGPTTGALTATSAEGVQVTAALHGTGGSDYVLYSQWHDWDAAPVFWAMLATTYSVTTEYTSEMADDFVVDDPAGWTISKVGFESFSWRFPAEIPLVEARLLDDADGRPAESSPCPASTSTVVLWEPPFDESRVEIVFSPPCRLAPGHYWLQNAVLQTHYSDMSIFGWGLQFVGETEEIPPVQLHPPVWRQPGGGSGYPGCFDWTSLSPPNCGLEEFAPLTTAYGTVFWLVGQATGDSVFADGFDRD